MKNQKILAWAIVNAFGAFLYILGVAWLGFNSKNLFGDIPDTFLNPIAVLMLFVLSALIESSLILGRPIYFYLEGRKSDAVKLLVYTVVVFGILTCAIFLTLIIL